jgi:hypothetical protein
MKAEAVCLGGVVGLASGTGEQLSAVKLHVDAAGVGLTILGATLAARAERRAGHGCEVAFIGRIDENVGLDFDAASGTIGASTISEYG